MKPLYLLISFIFLIVLVKPNYSQTDGKVDFTNPIYEPVTDFCISPFFPSSGEEISIMPQEYEDKIFVMVEDIDENINPAGIDSVIVQMFSKFDSLGTNTTLYENDTNTGIFKGFIKVDQISHELELPYIDQEDSLLQIRKGDTVKASYIDKNDGFGNTVETNVSALFYVINDLNAYSNRIEYTSNNSPYILRGENYIEKVEEGVVFKLYEKSFVRIAPNERPYSLAGTEDDPIVFTSIFDNPNENQLWDRIMPRAMSDGIWEIEWVKVEFAERAFHITKSTYDKIVFSNCNFSNNYIGLYINNYWSFYFPIEVNNSQFTNNKFAIYIHGLWDNIAQEPEIAEGCKITSTIITDNEQGITFDEASQGTFDNCLIAGNQYGIAVLDRNHIENAVINNSVIQYNSEFDVYNDSDFDIDCRFNWWGEETYNEIIRSSNPQDLTTIYDSYDNPEKGFVNYGSWKSSNLLLSSPELLENVYLEEGTMFAWTDPTGLAYEYGFQVGLDSLFTDILIDEKGLKETSFIVEDLPESAQLYWHVNQTNMFGTGDYSNTANFITLLNPPTYLRAEFNDTSNVYLSWRDKSQVETGFIIERKRFENPDDWNDGIPFEIIDTVGADSTAYVDNSIALDEHYAYRVKAFSELTSSAFSRSVSISTIISTIKKLEELPSQYSLSQNYPNPFNPVTTIEYSIPQSGHVSLKVFDIQGNEVSLLVDEEKAPGYYSVKLDGSRLSSGIYFYRIHMGEFMETRKLMLLK